MMENYYIFFHAANEDVRFWEDLRLNGNDCPFSTLNAVPVLSPFIHTFGMIYRIREDQQRLGAVFQQTPIWRKISKAHGQQTTIGTWMRMCILKRVPINITRSDESVYGPCLLHQTPHSKLTNYYCPSSFSENFLNKFHHFTGVNFNVQPERREKLPVFTKATERKKRKNFLIELPNANPCFMPCFTSREEGKR